jgi:hypothetical protein
MRRLFVSHPVVVCLAMLSWRIAEHTQIKRSSKDPGKGLADIHKKPQQLFYETAFAGGELIATDGADRGETPSCSIRIGWRSSKRTVRHNTANVNEIRSTPRPGVPKGESCTR